MNNSSVAQLSISKVSNAQISTADDLLAVEEPLEIRMIYSADHSRVEKSISVTMRTPGNDAELAAGFLFTEGIVRHHTEVHQIAHLPYCDDNIVVVTLNPDTLPDTSKLERHFYTTSSCGVCGKSSIDAVRQNIPDTNIQENSTIHSATLLSLPDILRQHQEVFEHTGGLHASALFTPEGTLLNSREDVGRHNALDKLIGAMLMKELLPLSGYILLLSGRASFELIQKAAMAGIKIIAAVGAPSSLAVQMAKENGITLVGFLKAERYNIYSHPERIKL
jgi:FdhD protein